MKQLHLGSLLNNRHGASAVIIAICLVMLLGFVALAIDMGHLYVARNELQNAADAGALAGASELFTADMTAINTDANQIAFDMATANIADGTAAEVENPLTNNGDVQRGHWSMNTRTFTPNASTVFVQLSGRTWNDLDADTDFINAVRVKTRRKTRQITSFFARIINPIWTGFEGYAEAVAYVGPAGSEMTWEIDAPIAICAQSVVQTEGYPPDPFDPSAPSPTGPSCWEVDPPGDIPPGWGNCAVSCSSGNMLDSGTDAGQPTSSHNTAAWINFTTDDVGGCDQADASDMDKLVCKGENALPAGVDTKIEAGENVGATGGVQASTYKKFKKCWEGAYNCLGQEDESGVCPDALRLYVDSADEGLVPEWTWKLKLPVVDCPGNNVSGCPEVVGVICVELIWMTNTGQPDPSLETPFKMTRWDINQNGEFVPDETWDVMEGAIPKPASSFAELENKLKTLQDDFNKPTPLSKYFEPQKFQCPTDEFFTTKLGTDEIPAPLSLSDPPQSFGTLFNGATLEGTKALGLFSGETAQYEFDPEFLKTPDPENPPYDPNNICNAQQLFDAYLHRKADAAGMGRWYSFVDKFNLSTYDGKPASLEKKTMYYTPECRCESQGVGTGGIFLGVLAKEPVLVK
jgi:Flp pilus assembly protein TadG